MKAQYNNTTKPNAFNQHLEPDKDTGHQNNLDQVAEELVQLAIKRLPNGVLQGNLRGLEEDIRQDAILLSLSWYMRQDKNSLKPSAYPWLAPRAIAAALRIQKQAYSKHRKRELQAMQSISEVGVETQNHPTLVSMSNWPSPVMRSVIEEAIRVAANNKRISLLNASIALEIFVNLTPVSHLAKTLKIHRSSIYQHLSRVRREIPTIIDSIEIQLHELM